MGGGALSYSSPLAGEVGWGGALRERAGLVKVGHVAIDETKVKANESKHKATSYDRMNETENGPRAGLRANTPT